MGRADKLCTQRLPKSRGAPSTIRPRHAVCRSRSGARRENTSWSANHEHPATPEPQPISMGVHLRPLQRLRISHLLVLRQGLAQETAGHERVSRSGSGTGRPGRLSNEASEIKSAMQSFATLQVRRFCKGTRFFNRTRDYVTKLDFRVCGASRETNEPLDDVVWQRYRAVKLVQHVRPRRRPQDGRRGSQGCPGVRGSA